MSDYKTFSNDLTNLIFNNKSVDEVISWLNHIVLNSFNQIDTIVTISSFILQYIKDFDISINNSHLSFYIQKEFKININAFFKELLNKWRFQELKNGSTYNSISTISEILNEAIILLNSNNNDILTFIFNHYSFLLHDCIAVSIAYHFDDKLLSFTVYNLTNNGIKDLFYDTLYINSQLQIDELLLNYLTNNSNETLQLLIDTLINCNCPKKDYIIIGAFCNILHCNNLQINMELIYKLFDILKEKEIIPRYNYKALLSIIMNGNFDNIFNDESNFSYFLN